MNVNIMKINIFLKMKFDLKGYAMERLHDFLSLSDLLILLQSSLTFLWKTFALVLLERSR